MTRKRRILGIVLLCVAAGVVSLGWLLSHDSPCSAAATAPGGTELMQAVVRHCYGPPQILKLEQIPRPVPKDDELLVKVHAAAVNPLDWHYLRGTPYLVRLDGGFGAPDNPRLGVDFAGTVEAVGRSVTAFKPGDEVFGGKFGAFAQYLSVSTTRAVVKKPAGISFEQAAALPIAAVTALQALRDKGHLQHGQKVLVNGASGGVGTYAVQIAKALGAEVTGVCSTRNLELVRSLGADHLIDYTREDFTRGSERYDLIIDTVGNHPLLANRRALTAKGALVIVGGPSNGNWIGPLEPMLAALALSPFLSQRFEPMLAELSAADLTLLAHMMEQGQLRSVIDRSYPLSGVAEAIRYLEAGHARGKVIIAVQ